MPKEIEFNQELSVWEDYPINKYGKKIDWWTSERGLALIAGWRSSGYTIKDVTTRMGVDARTFRAWRKKCPKLDDILAEGKDVANVRVENALFRRATGYYYDEVVKELVEGEMRTTKIITRYMHPDVKAALHYLYNRNSKDWRVVQQPIDVDGPALLNAENVLVSIRNEASVVSPLSSDDRDVLLPLVGETAQENAKEDGI